MLANEENNNIKRLYAIDDIFYHTYKDSKKQEWGIFREDEMLKKYPHGGYKIIGDLYKSKKGKTDYSLIKGNAVIPVRAYSGNIKKNEMIVGYIPLEQKDIFVRVINKKQSKYVGIAFLIVLLLSIFLGGLWIGQRNRPIDEPVAIRSGEITNPDPTNIRLPGIEKVYAKAGETLVNQLLLNVNGNVYDLQYTFILEDTGEEIYKSKIIEPGYGVKQFNMNRTFEKGEYPIIINVSSSAVDNESEDGNVAYNAGQLQAVLIVE